MINNSIKEIKNKVTSFQKNILMDLQPYIISSEDFLNSTHWFTTSANLYLYNQKNKLYISSENANKEYLSFMERNNSYSVLPSNKILSLPEEKIEIFIKGQLFGNIRASLMLVEYSSTEKIKVHNIDFNKRVVIKTGPATRYFRLGIKISETGILTFETFTFKRINDTKLHSEKNFIKTSVPTKKKINQLSDLNVACIFDEFTMTCYQEEVKLIDFTPSNWKDVLTQNRPDILMVESAWRGNKGTWEHKIASYNNQDQTSLFELINWCKEQSIPTVFWNKEDPIHFDRFINTAKHFDFIFTTDHNKIQDYTKHAGHNHVYSLPFSAEPKLHNPIKISDKRDDNICFAGSYYANRHEDRRKDMDEVLDICAKFGLKIYDRNYERNSQGIPGFAFPERFNSNILGSLKYDEIDKAYKGYKMMLNVNSVKNSPTMFSRRVFEGLACGTPIISTYSEGVKKIFKDIVLISESPSELENNLNKLMTNEQFYREKSLEGIREIFLNHTYKHRLKFILDKIGIEYKMSNSKVTVLGFANNQEEFHYLLDQFNNQIWIEKELVIFIDTFEGYTDILNRYNTGNIKTYIDSYIKAHYSRLSEIIKTSFVSYFDTENFYGENYLVDLMIAAEYSGADIIGKHNYYVYTNKKNKVIEKNNDKEYEFVSNLRSDSSIINMNVFQGEELSQTIDNFLGKSLKDIYFKKGFRLFSSDKYNFLEFGKKASMKDMKKIEL